MSIRGGGKEHGCMSVWWRSDEQSELPYRSEWVAGVPLVNQRLNLPSPFKEQQSHEHTEATPEAQTYLVDCNSEGNEWACSVRSHPGSCWNWGWTASADAGIFPRHPGYEKHGKLSQSADSAEKKGCESTTSCSAAVAHV